MDRLQQPLFPPSISQPSNRNWTLYPLATPSCGHPYHRCHMPSFLYSPAPRPDIRLSPLLSSLTQIHTRADSFWCCWQPFLHIYSSQVTDSCAPSGSWNACKHSNIQRETCPIVDRLPKRLTCNKKPSSLLTELTERNARLAVWSWSERAL